MKDLKVIPDERGYVMEMLRADDPEFAGFGQAYVLSHLPRGGQGGHYHK